MITIMTIITATMIIITHHDHDHDHGHVHDEHCGHSHGPTPDQLAGPGGWRRGLGAIFAVGMRPCSGAILVLVFSLAQGLFWAGIAATFVMGLGTAITVATIAVRRRVRQGPRPAAQRRPRRRRHADHARHRIRRRRPGAAVRPRPVVRLSRRRTRDVFVARPVAGMGPEQLVHAESAIPSLLSSVDLLLTGPHQWQRMRFAVSCRFG